MINYKGKSVSERTGKIDDPRKRVEEMTIDPSIKIKGYNPL